MGKYPGGSRSGLELSISGVLNVFYYFDSQSGCGEGNSCEKLWCMEGAQAEGQGDEEELADCVGEVGPQKPREKALQWEPLICQRQAGQCGSRDLMMGYDNLNDPVNPDGIHLLTDRGKS